MVGSGRHFNETGFLKKIAGIQGYVVSDITLFPEVPYWILPVELVLAWWKTGSLGSSTKISRRTALQLLEDATADA